MSRLAIISLGVAVLGVGLYFYAGFPTPANITLKKAPLLESILNEYRSVIGEDFEAYHNHCLRVFNLAVLASERRAPALSSDAKKKRDDVFEIATAFHDIGLWTDDTVAYLEPSEKRAAAWLVKHGRSQDILLVTALIEEHHKVNPYTGPFVGPVTDFLQADWSDVMLGLVGFGPLTRSDVHAVQAAYPNAGFHLRLLRFGLAQMQRDPFNPLPMFKL